MPRVLSVALLALACSGDGGKDGDPGTHTGTTPTQVVYAFQAEAPARATVGSLTEDTLAAHQMSSMFLASVAVVVADEKAQDGLITDGGGAGGGGGTGFECWDRPAIPMWTFDINYETCPDQGFDMGGGVSVEDHASGPLLFTFNTFRIEDRTLGGTLALDTRNAADPTMYWVTYNTDRTSPGLDNPVPMGVNTDGTPSGLTWLGGATVNFFTGNWTTWGTLTLRPGDRDFVIVHGGVLPSDVPADQTPGVDAVKSPLDWQSCRCPTAGLTTYDLDLRFDEVTIDLDDLEITENGVDDPEVTVVVDHTVSGKAQVRYKDTCGDFDIDYDVSDTVITVPNTTLTAATSFLCDIKVIEDPTECQKIIAALSQVGDFAIQVPEADVLATAKATADATFDGPWCEVY